MRSAIAAVLLIAGLFAQAPRPLTDGYSLPNGWRITPVGRAVAAEDLILNLTSSPDRRIVIAQHGGFNPHGLLVIDTRTEEPVQRIRLKSAWFGMAWSNDGRRLFVSGGNASHARHLNDVAPVYVFDYAGGRIGQEPAAEWRDDLPAAQIYWSGLAMHPKRDLLYAANRGADPKRGHISVFDTATGRVVNNIAVDVSPYDLQFNADGSILYVSNWAATTSGSSMSPQQP
ncbi:MAG TPA: hypothetical protein VFL57_03060 [Bryobacteraceae bacterium]|nr:hypothetical protein [Bryobacteraceae bacterium]